MVIPCSWVMARCRSRPAGGNSSIIRRWLSISDSASPWKWYALRITCITFRVGSGCTHEARDRTRARETATGDNGGVGTPPLVGREEQLRRLSRVLDEVFAGIGRLVF